MINGKTLRQIFSEAADYIERHGHLKRDYGGRFGRNGNVRDDGPACALGACATVAYPDRPQMFFGIGGERRAVTLLESLLPPDSSVPAWNDHPYTTEESVVALLREAATLAREEAL